ncbi:MAG TPA: P-II family nitrogen regulator [Clostridiales bacterium]|nr:P-II family nitrogen regulator [Clostridiales bacterium]
MIKVEAIVREEKYEDVKAALNDIDVHGMTVSQVMGCGVQKGYTGVVRGTKVDVNMLPKIKFEIVVPSQAWVDRTVKAIRQAALTGKHGDGKIFVYDLMDTVRIRTGQAGEDAIYHEETVY